VIPDLPGTGLPYGLSGECCTVADETVKKDQGVSAGNGINMAPDKTILQ
jgi:hypothetical protein